MNALLERLLGAPVSLEELKHKPGRRRTSRASGPDGTAIVKEYASGRAATVAARIGALAAGPAEPVLPRVLASEPALRLVVLSEVPGRPLRHALLAGDAATCRRAGEVLGGWHRAWRGRAPKPLRRHGIERELELLHRRAEGVAPPLGAAVRKAAAELGGPWDCSTVVHRDLYEEQIMVADRIGLIDLDDAALGPPELDVGNLLGHVDLLALRSGRDLSVIGEQLLAGYARTGAALDGRLLERCRLLTRLRLACIHDEPELSRSQLRRSRPQVRA